MLGTLIAPLDEPSERQHPVLSETEKKALFLGPVQHLKVRLMVMSFLMQFIFLSTSSISLLYEMII